LIDIPFSVPAPSHAGSKCYLNVDFVLKEDTMWASAGWLMAWD